VCARLPNPERQLRPGMLLTVVIENAPRMALSVPELSVIGEGESRFVYVVDQAGRAQRAAVRTGLRAGGRIEILEGLRPGQRVITEGVVKVADDMPVRLAGPRNAEPAARRRPAAPRPAG
jgi:membrane fusion protein, multidrug efflux system